jgi:hypothetical protein
VTCFGSRTQWICLHARAKHKFQEVLLILLGWGASSLWDKHRIVWWMVIDHMRQNRASLANSLSYPGPLNPYLTCQLRLIRKLGKHNPSLPWMLARSTWPTYRLMRENEWLLLQATETWSIMHLLAILFPLLWRTFFRVFYEKSTKEYRQHDWFWLSFLRYVSKCWFAQSKI